MRKVLGIYIVVVAVAQLLIYIAAAAFHAEVLFYFDPRFGLFLLQTFIWPYLGFPNLVGWLSTLPLLACGVAVLRHQRHIRTYFFVEAVLGLPTLASICLVMWANASPNDGFSVRELLVGPFWVFIVASVVPFCIAGQTLSDMRRGEGSEPPTCASA